MFREPCTYRSGRGSGRRGAFSKSPQAETLGVLPCKRVKQVSYREQCETKNGAREIEVVTNALLKPQFIRGNK
jgi:hypothetical protein